MSETALIELHDIPDAIPEDALLPLFLQLEVACGNFLDIPEVEQTESVRAYSERDTIQAELGKVITAKCEIYPASTRDLIFRRRLARIIAKCISEFASASLKGFNGRAECKRINVFVSTGCPDDWVVRIIYRKIGPREWEEDRSGRSPMGID